MSDKTDFNRPWPQYNFIVLDIEGTGAQHKNLEGIVEIAAIEISNKQLTSKSFYNLINPEITIPPFISRIHGIKNKDVENEPIFSSIKEQLLAYINNKILVGHNVGVDYRLLKLKMPEYTPIKIMDTMKMSKHLWGASAKHGLDDLIIRCNLQDQLINLPTNRARHSAYFDAFATALIFIKLMQEKFTDNTTLQDTLPILEINITSGNNQTNLF